MDLHELQRNWDYLGATDPLWAIATTNRNWDEAAFFRSGQDEVIRAMSLIGRTRLPLRRERCLDFGCGAGRLTQALCYYFAACHGVDIAPSMIALAQQYNRFGTRCQYHLNEQPDLRLFECRSFDLVFSRIVLQHMHPDYARAYLAEFLRVLRPGGIAYFQIPSELTVYSAAVQERFRKQYALPASGCRARLTLCETVATMQAGGTAALVVQVENTGDTRWRASMPPGVPYEIKLGSFWIDTATGERMASPARARLPHDVAPGGTAMMQLGAVAPPHPGSYTLELDMVQEGIVWFSHCGSAPTYLPVQVEPAPLPPEAPFEPVMEMYAHPPASIAAVVRQHGGRLLNAEHIRGEGWVSSTYMVVKA